MDFEEVLQDIFNIPRLLGSFPFNRKFRISKKLLAYCCLFKFLSAFGADSALIYSTKTYVKNENENSIEIALRTIAVLYALGDFFTLIWYAHKRHKMSYLMESVIDIQRRKKITVERKCMRFVHYLLVYSLATYIFTSWAHCIQRNCLVSVFCETFYLLSNCSDICFVSQFWDILHLLGHLFRESTQLYDESSVISYERFITLCAMVNEIYGAQILFKVTQKFLMVILYLYILLLPLYPGINYKNMLIIIGLTDSIIPLGSIIFACNYYKKQERNFNDDLRRRIIEEKSRVLLRNEKLNFHFVVGQETVFSACGFFNVDMSLICSMISAATTYLVIVLQYGSESHIQFLNSTLTSSKNI